jgi:hypothetical protein
MALTPDLNVLCPDVTVDPAFFAQLAEEIDDGEFARSVHAVRKILSDCGIV